MAFKKIHKRAPDKQTELRQAERRRDVAKLYLKGWRQADIAEALNIATATVGKDLLHLQTEWEAEGLIDFDKAKAIELAKIDRLEMAAWEGWDASRQGTVETSRKVTSSLHVVDPPANSRKKPKSLMLPTSTDETSKTRSNAGDSSFLDKISWCIDTRLKLLGAYPKDNKPTGTNMTVINWGDMYYDPAQPMQRMDPVKAFISKLESSISQKEETAPEIIDVQAATVEKEPSRSTPTKTPHQHSTSETTSTTPHTPTFEETLDSISTYSPPEPLFTE